MNLGTASREKIERDLEQTVASVTRERDDLLNMVVHRGRLIQVFKKVINGIIFKLFCFKKYLQIMSKMYIYKK